MIPIAEKGNWICKDEKYNYYLVEEFNDTCSQTIHVYRAFQFITSLSLPFVAKGGYWMKDNLIPDGVRSLALLLMEDECHDTTLTEEEREILKEVLKEEYVSEDLYKRF